jgi:hypothetical protein
MKEMKEMKYRLIPILYFLLHCHLYSQTDSSANSFFPANIGDSLHYQYTQSQGYITTLTRDSIVNGSRFLFFDSSSVPKYEIDSILNVVCDPTTTYKTILYKLTAKKGESWISEIRGGRTWIIARVDDVFWNFVLGSTTQVKHIGYYYQPLPDTTIFSNWRNDDYIAAGFGFYLQITDAMQTPAEELFGCIIDGKTYGIMTTVEDKTEKSIASYYKLYSAFPNPFNPSTTISYFLPKSNAVKLSVFNILGIEVSNLVDVHQSAGLHSVRFEPTKLSNGVYFVRLHTEQFTATNKIIYSK